MPLKSTSCSIQEFLSSFGDKNLLFVGVGNVLKSDDGVGVYICQRVKQTPTISTLTVEVSIENYIGKINALKPDVLILIDCMSLGLPPGEYKIVEIDNIVDLTFNTHNISLNRLKDFFDMPTYILGIQPLRVEFGETLSNVVQEKARKILSLINQKEVCHG